ncbi:MAG: hypothetical protein AABY22_03615 [Nanoarchaeota archaeon]
MKLQIKSYTHTLVNNLMFEISNNTLKYPTIISNLAVMKNKKLKTVFNYAKKIKCSTTWVYAQIKNKKLKSEKIDGVTFIICN